MGNVGAAASAGSAVVSIGMADAVRPGARDGPVVWLPVVAVEDGTAERACAGAMFAPWLGIFGLVRAAGARAGLAGFGAVWIVSALASEVRANEVRASEVRATIAAVADVAPVMADA